MNLSLNWLSALLNRALNPREVGDLLARAGAPVEAEEALHQDLGDVIVALVEKVDKHPNADRLSLCQVNDGSGLVEVVCGAPNVTAGRKYPYARVGVTLPGGFKLESRKIRGVLSNGMLCSAKELGLGLDHDGILELNTDAAPGTPFLDAMPLADYRITIEVTANRPDLLGHKGVARELAAAYGVPVRLPAFPGAPADVRDAPRAKSAGAADGVEVRIEDAEGCPRYLAAVIRGVKVAPSPDWLQARLRAIGARPINNVVDATNYILFELNQPLHAFDLARLKGPAIVVRRARPGERITTLDGVVRAPDAEMTLICDAETPVAVAGVMGGQHSEVSNETTDILLECAYFESRRVRRTRKALKLTTEASYRFERGIDLHGAPAALRRAVELMVAVAGGKVTGAVDVYPAPVHEPTVFLRTDRVAHLLGVAVPVADIERHLVSVGFAVAPKDHRLAVQVPGWRPDVTGEVDLIEEVARLRGYDSFPVEIRPFRPSLVPDDPGERVKDAARRLLTGRGLNETRSFPLGAAGSAEAVALENPMAADEAHLRTDLWPGLVRALEHNWAVRERDVRLFEIGTVFHQPKTGNRPVETLRLAAVVSGARTPAHWTASGKAPQYDRWDVKALFEEAVALAGAPGRVVEAGEGWVLEDESARGRGWAKELSADRPAWAAGAFGFELDVHVGERRPVVFAPLPGTPPVERDLALVLKPGVRAAQVEAAMRRVGAPLLETCRVFDEYRSEQVGGRSVAWRLVFRAGDRTLRDEEVDPVVKKIVATLKEELDARLRES